MAYTLIFLQKKCKLLTFFSKNTCELDIVLTRTITILTTNELVKVTMLWTTGPLRIQVHNWNTKNLANMLQQLWVMLEVLKKGA